MALFPTSLDNFTNPTASNKLNNPSHSQQHGDANDAIEALEAKVGVNSSAVTSSLDYKVTQLTAGWTAITATLTYASANTITTSADLTGSIGLGHRLKITQSAVVIYAIITKITSTVLTVFVENNANLTNVAISSPAYSYLRFPPGFSTDLTHWTIEFKDTTDRTQNTPTSGTWYNINSNSLIVPIGGWTLYYQCSTGGAANGSGSFNQWTTLSTTNNGESNVNFTSYKSLGAASGNSIYSGEKRQDSITLTAQTTYYLNHKTSNAGVGNINVVGSEGACIIRAMSNYY